MMMIMMNISIVIEVSAIVRLYSDFLNQYERAESDFHQGLKRISHLLVDIPNIGSSRKAIIGR